MGKEEAAILYTDKKEKLEKELNKSEHKGNDNKDSK